MKKAFWASAIVLIIAFVAGITWWMIRPQVIVLNNGTKLILLGVTYGNYNLPPKTTVFGKRISARLYNTNKTAVAWILAEHESTPSILLLAVSDAADTGTIISQERGRTSVQKDVEILEFNLNSFPSRDRKMVLRVLNYENDGLHLAKGRFVVRNPNRGPFPQWATKSIPDTESDGDLDVTLANINCDATPLRNAFTSVPQNDPLNQALNKTVEIGFNIEQKGVSTTNWYPQKLVMSDATGNSFSSGIEQGIINNQSSYFFHSGLWPDEPVWKLRVEFSKTSGFNSDELCTVSNIPVIQGTIQDTRRDLEMKNRPITQVDINGVHVKIYPAIQYEYPREWVIKNGNRHNVTAVFSIESAMDNADNCMVVSATDDQGHTLKNPYPTGSTFAETNTIQSMNVTMAVSKSRFVEFTVKPKQ